MRYAAHAASGNATGVAAGSTVNGNALFIGSVNNGAEKEHISALVTVDAETDTITMAAAWEVGNTDATWFSVANAPQNPAAVVLATGTAGADAAVTKAVPVPDAVYGFKFARCTVVVGVTTGTTNDTYSIAYNYRQLDKGETTDSHLRFNSHAASGTVTGVAAGGQADGNALFMGGLDQKIAHLSALVTVDAETDTITLAGKWQGSNDNSTWVDLAYEPQNPAVVVLATGTAGADAAVTRVLPAPKGAYSHRYARCSVEVGVTTGTSNDTYSIAYNYRQFSAGGHRE
jgi:hypothetical protein